MSDDLHALQHRHGITVTYIRRNDPSRRWCARAGGKVLHAPTEREATAEMVEWLSI